MFHDSNRSELLVGRHLGGFGWQIVDQFVGIDADWTYMPSGCPMTAPVNTTATGGGTFAGMGPSLDGGACSPPQPLGDGGSCEAPVKALR